MTLSMRQRESVVAEARSWVGTPYHHRARVKGAGVDCAQLLIGVFAACGLVEPFDTGEYPQDWAHHRDDERFLAWVSRHADPVAYALPGDVLVFKFFRCYSHGAIVISDTMMVHSYVGRGVEVVERSEYAHKPQLAFTLRGGVDVR